MFWLLIDAEQVQKIAEGLDKVLPDEFWSSVVEDYPKN